MEKIYGMTLMSQFLTKSISLHKTPMKTKTFHKPISVQTGIMREITTMEVKASIKGMKDKITILVIGIPTLEAYPTLGVIITIKIVEATTVDTK